MSSGREWPAGMPRFTCPACSVSTPNRGDVDDGYCAVCHDRTGSAEHYLYRFGPPPPGLTHEQLGELATALDDMMRSVPLPTLHEVVMVTLAPWIAEQIVRYGPVASPRTVVGTLSAMLERRRTHHPEG